MSNEPVSQDPSPAPETVAADEEHQSPAETKLSPKEAILRAARINLEYARQSLDRFEHWPDYILATHYYANVLALTGNESDRRDAVRLFGEVASWLQPGAEQRRFDDARERIRAEALYNRAVLLAADNKTEDARKGFQAVLALFVDHTQQHPKGVRVCAEFSLIMLFAQKLRDGKTGGERTAAERVAKSRTEWDQQTIPFLTQLEAHRKQLEAEVQAADSEVASLEPVLDRLKEQLARLIKRQPSALETAKYTRQVVETEEKKKNAQARITKASKDLSIIRTMDTRVRELERELFPDLPKRTA